MGGFFFLLVQIKAPASPIINSPAKVTPTPTPAFAPVLSPDEGKAVVEDVGFVTEAGRSVVLLVDVGCDEEVGVLVAVFERLKVLLPLPPPPPLPLPEPASEGRIR
jgi:hypothetical protein